MVAGDEHPLLTARAARISIDDRVVWSDLSFEARGPRLVLVGAHGPLFAALSGIPLGALDSARAAAHDDDLPAQGSARVSAGELCVGGRPVGSAAHFASVGCVPLDAPAAPDVSVLELMRTHVRLGAGAREVDRRALSALSTVGLGASAKRPVRSLNGAERRVLSIAAAISCEPLVLIADRPLSGLTGAAAEQVFLALSSACAGRGAIVFVSDLVPGTPDGTLARAASDLCVFHAGSLVACGPPGEVLRGARLFRLQVTANAEPLRAALEELGMELRGGPHHFALSLGSEHSASDVLAAASRVRASVVELVPVIG